MTQARKQHRKLTDSRVYVRGTKFAYLGKEPVTNPWTGKKARWVPLCPVTDGEARALALAQQVIDFNMGRGSGDLTAHMRVYLHAILSKREEAAPTDAARLKMHRARSKEIERVCNVIIEAFADFNVANVRAVDVATFVDQWAGQRAAEIYKARLSDFMGWCVRKGYREDNPCREVKLESARPRKRYITDAEYHAIRKLLAPMVQCYVDLCYLLYQRTTEIRLLRWNQIAADGIFFQPTKTEDSSGARVLVPMTPEIQAVLDRAKAIGPVSSVYVIHTQEGQPFTTTGIGSAWRRARAKSGVHDATLKDLRAKALTDAERAGYKIEEISVGAAHTNVQQTQDYIKLKRTPTSRVTMRLPKE
jgi:integrase